jgi:enamine deaminase RidA (YjgF/YER057c/UK114 family)
VSHSRLDLQQLSTSPRYRIFLKTFKKDRFHLRGQPMSVSMRHDPFPVKNPYHGIYAHGVETKAGARVLHVSGQVGASPEGYLPKDFRGQCRHAINNLESVLRAAEMNLNDIVKMSFFLVRREDMDQLVDVRKELLDGVRPAITTVFVAGLVSPDWLVEVEAIACAE